MMSRSSGQNICRQPVVAVVGHIDHGKTTLLDYIRKSSVAAREAGGITQRISAYEIEHPYPSTGSGQAKEVRAITFIDTPGHEAFQKMRRRGASAADIAILVVAADDGVKPQTKEAWAAIQEAKIPTVVAFTKIDKENVNLDRAKESVVKEGIYLEGLGGDVPWVGVSGKTGDGVSELLDLIILAADLHGVECDASADAHATVIESSRDQKTGVSATVIVRTGTFTTGAFAVAGDAWTPIRILEDAAGTKVKEMRCGKPARISGFSTEPAVGADVIVVNTKKEAETLAANATKKPSSADATGGMEAEVRTPIRIIIKADTAGSVEALEYELARVPHPNADLIIVAASPGPVTENEVKNLIGFENALVLGFNVKLEPVAKDLAERQGITIEMRDIIYELSEWLTKKIAELAPDQVVEALLGSAKILKEFSIAGSKHVVGAKVEKGLLKRGNTVTIIRRGIEVGKGKILNIQSQKADVDNVSEGAEFGAQVDTKADLVQGDIIESRPDSARGGSASGGKRA
jgi:translation initiation factor IF-2